MPDEKKKRTINRLQTMYPLRALIDGMYERAVEASKEGKPTVSSMALRMILGIERSYMQ